MPKLTRLENVKVIVELNDPGDFGICRIGGIKRDTKELMFEAERIKGEIKRRVDDIGQVYVEKKYRKYCSFCGDKWTEDGNDYNGGCCQKDQESEDYKQRNISDRQSME